MCYHLWLFIELSLSMLELLSLFTLHEKYLFSPFMLLPPSKNVYFQFKKRIDKTKLWIVHHNKPSTVLKLITFSESMKNKINGFLKLNWKGGKLLEYNLLLCRSISRSHCHLSTSIFLFLFTWLIALKSFFVIASGPSDELIFTVNSMKNESSCVEID